MFNPFEKNPANTERLEPSPEQIEKEIKELLEFADKNYLHLYDQFEEWWWGVENEAMAGRDRRAAIEHLKEFVDFLRQKNEKTTAKK